MKKETQKNQRRKKSTFIHSNMVRMISHLHRIIAIAIVSLSAITNTQGADVIVGSSNVTALVDDLTPCSKECLTGLPGFSLPVTIDQLRVLCPRQSLAVAYLTQCLVVSSCPANDLVSVKLLLNINLEISYIDVTSYRFKHFQLYVWLYPQLRPHFSCTPIQY